MFGALTLLNQLSRDNNDKPTLEQETLHINFLRLLNRTISLVDQSQNKTEITKQARTIVIQNFVTLSDQYELLSDTYPKFQASLYESKIALIAHYATVESGSGGYGYMGNEFNSTKFQMSTAERAILTSRTRQETLNRQQAQRQELLGHNTNLNKNNLLQKETTTTKRTDPRHGRNANVHQEADRACRDPNFQKRPQFRGKIRLKEDDNTMLTNLRDQQEVHTYILFLSLPCLLPKYLKKYFNSFLSIDMLSYLLFSFFVFFLINFRK